MNVADKIKAHVFYDSRWDAPKAEREKLLSQELFTLAHVTGGRLPAIDWTIQVQPIGNSQLGIVIYNASGKTMHAGTIAYDENRSAIRLNALYPNVTNVCKQTFEAIVTHTSDDGNPTVAGKVTMSYEV